MCTDDARQYRVDPELWRDRLDSVMDEWMTVAQACEVVSVSDETVLVTSRGALRAYNTECTGGADLLDTPGTADAHTTDDAPDPFVRYCGCIAANEEDPLAPNKRARDE